YGSRAIGQSLRYLGLRSLLLQAILAKVPGFINSMKRHILIYGLLGGILITLLKLMEYRFLVIERSVEIYGGLVAALFAALGIWLGLRLTNPKQKVIVREIPVAVGDLFVLNEAKLNELGITRRELEILEWIAKGLSNREIAEKLFVSENTVKTHSSRVFEKLSAKRRTQAVQIGKELGLLP
ncbi:MAG TPA: LuxR C-terminal-related transcriptional regulator, partial [Terriglobia bacterium]|nr:LuxR C-terminal-related transcriptional regulator [Terriglobia bacterium]